MDAKTLLALSLLWVRAGNTDKALEYLREASNCPDSREFCEKHFLNAMSVANESGQQSLDQYVDNIDKFGPSLSPRTGTNVSDNTLCPSNHGANDVFTNILSVATASYGQKRYLNEGDEIILLPDVALASTDNLLPYDAKSISTAENGRVAKSISRKLRIVV